MKKIITILFLLFNTICFVYANDVSISASVDKTKCTLNEQIVLSINVSGGMSKLPRPTIPALNGFTVHSGGTSQNTTIINGKISVSFRYTYILKPQRLGKLIIPPIRINYKTTVKQTNPINIEILNTSQIKTQNNTTSKQISKPLFIQTSVNKLRAFVSEPIILTMKFYRRVQIISSPKYSAPNANGFIVNDLNAQREYTENIHGHNYRVIETKTMLFPTTVGTFTIGKANLKCHIRENRQSNDFFGAFFSSGKLVTLESKPINIKVSALPKNNKPESFTGTVGSYSLNMSVSPKKLNVNDALNLNIEISGEGNIKAIGEVKLKNVSNFKKYETLSSVTLNQNTSKLTGKKSFKMVLVPLVHGKLKIPDVEFSYFDFKTKKYKTLKSKPEFIKVLPSKSKNTTLTGIPTISGDDLKIITKDIRFIKTKSNLKFGSPFIFNSKLYWFIIILIPSLYIIFILITFYINRMNKNISTIKQKKALAIANRSINKLSKKISKEKIVTPENIFEIFSRYLSDKYSFSHKGLSLKLFSDLKDKNIITQNIYTQIQDIWEEINFLRFSKSVSKNEDSIKLLEKLKKMLKEIT